MSKIKRVAVIAAVFSLLSLTGCVTYYQVNDPSTGKAYYTTKIDHKDGTTDLKDAKSGADVTIQNSEVIEITKDQYEHATHDPNAK